MASKKELISSADLDSIRARYVVPIEIELSVARHDETYNDQRSRFICINEFMLKVVVKLTFEFGVVESLNVFYYWKEGIRNPWEATPAPLPVKVLWVEPFKVEELAKVYAKIEKVVIEERVVEALSRDKAKRAKVKVSLTKDLKTILIKAKDNQMLKLKNALLLRAILSEAAGLLKPQAARRLRT
ncbi:hypothetical protein ACLOJK_039650 [Asimina triloba]